jgi:hypothetical protein
MGGVGNNLDDRGRLDGVSEVDAEVTAGLGAAVEWPSGPPASDAVGGGDQLMHAFGRGAGLAILDTLELGNYRYFHSTHADLLRRAGRHNDARHAYQRALDLARTDFERRFLQDRITELKPHD